jgi:hypothetical protein
MFVQKAGCFRLESFQNITELSKTAVDTAGPNKNRSCGQFNGSDAGGRVGRKRRSFGRVGTSRHPSIDQNQWSPSVRLTGRLQLEIRTGGRYWSVREPSVAAAYSGDGAV